jgi:L-amino acid N-acyltransferase YncA
MFRIMSLSELTARVRTVWESLAGAPGGFGPEVRVAVSPGSLLSLPGWPGLVVIGGEAIATAPDERTARFITDALSGVAAESAADAAVLARLLPIGDMIGPAALAYVDAEGFRPRPGPETVAVDATAPALQRLLAEAAASDAGESGLAEITSPAFVVRAAGEVAAAAGYADWPGGVAHLSVLTAARARGRGLGAVASSAAVTHALAAGKLPQWRARVEASRRIARGLGFHELGAQVGFRLTTG